MVRASHLHSRVTAKNYATVVRMKKTTRKSPNCCASERIAHKSTRRLPKIAPKQSVSCTYTNTLQYDAVAEDDGQGHAEKKVARSTPSTFL